MDAPIIDAFRMNLASINALAPVSPEFAAHGPRSVRSSSHSSRPACHVVEPPTRSDMTGGRTMTTTEFETKPDGVCTPDGGCAVVERHGARMGHPAMIVPPAMA